MGSNPAATLQASPALNTVAASPSAQLSPSNAHGPSSLTPSLTVPHPSASASAAAPAAAIASSSGAAEPHYGSSTSGMAPAALSPLQLPQQLPGQGTLSNSGQQASSSSSGHDQQHFGPGDLLDTSILADRGKAFDLFRSALEANQMHTAFAAACTSMPHLLRQCFARALLTTTVSANFSHICCVAWVCAVSTATSHIAVHCCC